MGYIVFDKEPDKKQRKQHAGSGQEKIGQAFCLNAHVVCQQVFDKLYGILEHNSSQSAEKPNNKRQK